MISRTIFLKRLAAGDPPTDRDDLIERAAPVATARKIAVLMLTLWKDETEYQWTKEATA
ncbi:hypothetical protein [Rhodovulum sp. BSW8]|uniref:hypothetical protein n=1 Tax=Rhodovulum sp. BSW8 TaxID=2259645 RepID=UPI0014040457|nr:hypothetical protein [Rhodovulum sp. BSW8]